MHGPAETGHELAVRDGGLAAPTVWEAHMMNLSAQMDVLRAMSVKLQDMSAIAHCYPRIRCRARNLGNRRKAIGSGVDSVKIARVRLVHRARSFVRCANSPAAYRAAQRGTAPQLWMGRLLLMKCGSLELKYDRSFVQVS